MQRMSWAMSSWQRSLKKAGSLFEEISCLLPLCTFDSLSVGPSTIIAMRRSAPTYLHSNATLAVAENSTELLDDTLIAIEVVLLIRSLRCSAFRVCSPNCSAVQLANLSRAVLD